MAAGAGATQVTKDEQIQAMLLNFVNTHDGFDEYYTGVVATVTFMAVHIERGIIRWDPERQCLVKCATGEEWPTRH
jgi:hypothetical protein